VRTSSIRTDVIELLADGELHSGADLARRMQCSRTAIWKRLQQLQEFDLEVEAMPGRGYRLSRTIELLDRDAICQGFSADVAAAVEALELHAVTESTNAVLNAGTPASPDRMRVALAEYQTGGRGRRGRRWVSPFGSGLCLSVGWMFPLTPPNLPALSLAVGVAVHRALSGWCPAGIGLKWPNDIVAGDRKLGGMLIDAQGESGGPINVVIGIGINIDTVAGIADRFDTDDSLGPVCLRDLAGGRNVSRNAVTAEIVNALFSVLREFQATGFQSMAEDWRQRDAMCGREVCLRIGERSQSGTAVGIDDSGALLFDDGKNVTAVLAGDVTLRRAAQGERA
jgi:BirA family biotin operon repressor/biotin-[acetyl-CoA-carboxylase] ligase